MATMTEYAQGIPNWLDVSTPDPAASRAFYEALFGWSFTEHEGGGYWIARKGERKVAGMGKLDPSQGTPPVWSMYIAVDDVAAATERAKGAGGQVLVGPMDVMGEGTMSFVIDPAGAAVGLWEAKTHIGAEAVNEHGAFNWSEVITDEPETLDPFYAEVVGARFRDIEFGDATYHAMHVDGRVVGGTMKPWTDDTPPHWHVYFMVDDADEAAVIAKREGGAVLAGPIDTPAGRMVTIQDPHGAVFSVIRAVP